MRQLHYDSVILIVLKSHFHLAAFGEVTDQHNLTFSKSASSTTLQTHQHASPATRLQHSILLTISARLTV